MKPKQNEYHPFFRNYIDLATGSNLLDALESGLDTVSSFYLQLPKDKLHYRYAENKWTPLQMLGHLTDTERVFQYRALRIVREPNAVLKSYDENLWAEQNPADSQSLVEALENYRAVRQSTIALYKTMSPEDLLKTGEASKSTLSSRAIGWLLCGHEIHHLNIMRQRYL